MTLLALALIAFVGTHFAMSHPLRAPLVARFGAGGFQAIYIGVSFATLGWAVHAFREAPYGMPLWTAGDGLWAVATAFMLVGSILLAGSFVGNPALPQPGADAIALRPARGVFAITRHPMMWSFAIWALVHVLVSPRPAVILLSGAMALLALLGARFQDGKKAMVMGESWRGWEARTAFMPFGGQMTGRIGWATAWPGPAVLAGGTLLWLAASWGHPWLGAPAAGIWRWLG